MTIISHTHRLIFLRTRKTASTSIEFALLPHLTRRDFISTSTGVEPLDHPWWRTTNRTTGWPREVALKERLGTYPPFRRFAIYKHEPAHGVRRAVRPSVWDRYTKIAVERHPYDRVISMWRWRTREHEDPPTLRRFVRFLEREREQGKSWRGRGTKWQLYSNWPVYTIDDELVVDHLLRWEELDSALPKVLDPLGIPELRLGRHKSSHRKGAAPSEELLDQELRERIHALYRREFEVLGYQP